MQGKLIRHAIEQLLLQLRVSVRLPACVSVQVCVCVRACMFKMRLSS